VCVCVREREGGGERGNRHTLIPHLHRYCKHSRKHFETFLTTNFFADEGNNPRSTSFRLLGSVFFFDNKLLINKCCISDRQD
jgi:hypothetical protein